MQRRRVEGTIDVANLFDDNVPFYQYYSDATTDPDGQSSQQTSDQISDTDSDEQWSLDSRDTMLSVNSIHSSEDLSDTDSTDSGYFS